MLEYAQSDILSEAIQLEFLVQGIGTKNNKSMKKSIKDHKQKEFKGTFGSMRLMTDSLPSSDDLIRKQKSHKITIALSDDSVTFFKDESTRLSTPYQRLIRNLLQEYVDMTRDKKASFPST